MARSHPHPLALFSLKPANDRARSVVAHPSNSYLVSTLSDGTLALDIGPHIRSQSCGTLATLGRNGTDIILEGSSIARLQCSFEFDLESRLVMFYDRSNGQSTQVSGKKATPFEYGRLRRVLVQHDLNTRIGIGGVRYNLIEFDLHWHQTPIQVATSQGSMFCSQVENPCFAQTMDGAPTIMPSKRVTRIHTAGERVLRMRYVTIGEPLGVGQFGAVYKSIDVDSGKFMAVKQLRRPAVMSHEGWRQSLYYTVKREVETLSRINHGHIVDYIASQGWEGPVVEIFMGLKEGTLKSLVEKSSGDTISIARSLFPQMLQAIDCLSFNNIIHRDVKPANILYDSLPGGEYQFQLGDFGVSNHAISATNTAGSPLYMAPEMFQKGTQTSKADVWSLFVTLLWTLDVQDFRQRSTQFKTIENVLEAVLFAASKADVVSEIQEMAFLDPEKRASAAHMLVKHYNGAGLSTPRTQVLALTNSPSSATAAAEALAPNPPALATRTTRTNPRSLGRDVFTLGVVGQCRVEKARTPRRLLPAKRCARNNTKN